MPPRTGLGKKEKTTTVRPEITSRLFQLPPDLLEIDGFDTLVNLGSAVSFVKSLEYCTFIKDVWIGLSVAEIIGVFFFEIVAESDEYAEEFWIIVGDIPPGMIFPEMESETPLQAVQSYI